MIPSPKAAQQATLGLGVLAQENPELFSTPPALLAKKIQNREILNDVELAKIRDFHKIPHEKTAYWVMASQLYGGQPLLDQLEAIPVKQPEPQAVIWAKLADEASTILQTKPEYECDLFKLSYIGDLKGLSELELMQAEQVCQMLASTWGPFNITAQWKNQTVTASGYETKVVFNHPDLYLFKHNLDACMNQHGVPYNDSEPWQPSLTQSVSPVETDIELFAPFNTTADALVLDWGGETQEFKLKGAKQQITKPVTAAATHANIIKGLNKSAIKELERLDTIWLNSLSSIIQMAVNQALEKIGRSLKKNSPEVYMTLTASPMEPIAIAVLADDKIFDNINFSQLISAPLDDAIKNAEELTRKHLQSILNIIGQFFSIDLNLKNKFTTEFTKASRLLRNRLKDWIRWRVATPDGEAKLDDFTKIVEPPSDIVRDYAQVAGGDDIEKNDNNIYKPVGVANAIPGLGLNIVGLEILNKVYDFYKGSETTQIKRKEESSIEETQLLALESLGPDSDAVVSFNYVWTPNYYEPPIKTEHHPEHEPNFGLKVVSTDELASNNRRPGDHPHCKCGWKPIIE